MASYTCSSDLDDTRDGSSPTRDTLPGYRNDSDSPPIQPSSPESDESSSSQEESPGEDNQDDSDTESPFRNDEDSPTNQSPNPELEDDSDLVTTEKRRLAQIKAEKDSDERARLWEDLQERIAIRRASEASE